MSETLEQASGRSAGRPALLQKILREKAGGRAANRRIRPRGAAGVELPPRARIETPAVAALAKLPGGQLPGGMSDAGMARPVEKLEAVPETRPLAAARAASGATITPKLVS